MDPRLKKNGMETRQIFPHMKVFKIILVILGLMCKLDIHTYMQGQSVCVCVCDQNCQYSSMETVIWMGIRGSEIREKFIDTFRNPANL